MEALQILHCAQRSSNTAATSSLKGCQSSMPQCAPCESLGDNSLYLQGLVVGAIKARHEHLGTAVQADRLASEVG